MSGGFIYVMSNPSLRDGNGRLIYKVGGTTRPPRQRALELSSSSSVPERFDVLLQHRCRDWKAVEYAVHYRLRKFRIGKEFFKAPLGEIAAVIRDAQFGIEGQIRDVTDSIGTSSGTVRPSIPREARRRSRVLTVRFGKGTTATIFCDPEMASYTSACGTISIDLPQVTRRIGAARLERVRPYLAQSAAAEAFVEFQHILEPSAVLLPAPSENAERVLAINGEPLYTIGEAEKKHWFSARRTTIVTARLHDEAFPESSWRTIVRSGPSEQRETVHQSLVDAALRNFAECAAARFRRGKPGFEFY